MDGFKQKLGKQQSHLNQIITKASKGMVDNQAEPQYDPVMYDENFINTEVNLQVNFRNKIAKVSRNAGAIYEQIRKPKSFDETDIKNENEKLAYFQKGGKTKYSTALKASWENSMKAYGNETEFNLQLKNNKPGAHTLDYMKSTRRYMAICAKKKELEAQNFKQDEIDKLNEDKKEIINGYKTSILKLAPALEAIPTEKDNLTGEVQITKESIEAYKAYLRLVMADPLTAIKNAVMDTVHSVNMTPDKTLDPEALPYTFDRAMQIRDRFDAVDRLADISYDPKHPLAAADEVEKLMTELHPKEKRNRAKEGNDDADDQNGDVGFTMIKLLTQTLNSDIKAGLDNAGFTYKEKSFFKRNILAGNGNAYKEQLSNLRQNMSLRTIAEKRDLQKKNEKYWADREKALYDSIKLQNNNENEENQGKKVKDRYKIRETIEKCRLKAGSTEDYIYNKELGDELVERASKISTLIDEVSDRLDKSEQALKSDEVLGSKDLGRRIQAGIERDKFRLLVLLERSRGYVNAISHVFNNKALSASGKNILEDASIREVKFDDNTVNKDLAEGWVTKEIRSTARVKKSVLANLNRIGDHNGDESVKIQIPRTEEEMFTLIKETLLKQDQKARELQQMLSNPANLKKEENIKELIDFRNQYLAETELFNTKYYSTKKAEKNGIERFKEILSKEEKTKFEELYMNLNIRCRFVINQVEQYRSFQISGLCKGGNVPEGIALSEKEKQIINAMQGKNRAEKMRNHFDSDYTRLKVERRALDKILLDVNTKELEKAFTEDEMNEDPQHDMSLEGILNRAKIKKSNNVLDMAKFKSLADAEKARRQKRGEQDQNPNNDEKENNLEHRQTLHEDNNNNDNNDNNDDNNDNNDNENELQRRTINNNIKRGEGNDGTVGIKRSHTVTNFRVRKKGEQRDQQNGGAGGDRDLHKDENLINDKKNEQENKDENLINDKKNENIILNNKDDQHIIVDQNIINEQEHHEEEHHEEEIHEQQYKPVITTDFHTKRINSGAAIKDGEDKSIVGLAKYIISIYKLAKNVSDVTWDTIRPELEYWLKGKQINEIRIVKKGEENNQTEELEAYKTQINEDNLEQEMGYIKEKLLSGGFVVDESQFNEEEKALYGKVHDDEPELQEGSLQAILKDCIGVKDTFAITEYLVNYTTDHEQDQDKKTVFIKDFLNLFSDRYDQNVEQYKDIQSNKKKDEDTTIPREDEGLIKWFLNEMPKDENVSLKQIDEFRRKWDKKLAYDTLNNKNANPITRRKIRHLLDSWRTTAEREFKKANNTKILADLDKVDPAEKIPDTEIPDIHTNAPNLTQWYGASCWATSGSVIANYHINTVLKNPQIKVDQGTFVHPKNLEKINPISEFNMKNEGKQLDGGLNKEYKSIQRYLKPGGGYGNLYQNVDRFLENMPATGVKYLRFSANVNDADFKEVKKQDRKRKLVHLLFKKIQNLIDTEKCPISLHLPGHYRTIIGVKDNKIICRDSAYSKFGEGEVSFDVDQFINEWESTNEIHESYTLELSYLKKLDGPDKEELEQKYGYSYDENGKLKYSVLKETVDASSTEKMMQNLGLEYEDTANLDEKGFPNKYREPKDVLDKYMQEKIYVPKHLNNKTNVANEEKKMQERRKVFGLEKNLNENEKKALNAMYKDADKSIASKRRTEKKNMESYKQRIPALKVKDKLDKQQKKLQEEAAKKKEEQRKKLEQQEKERFEKRLKEFVNIEAKKPEEITEEEKKSLDRIKWNEKNNFKYSGYKDEAVRDNLYEKSLAFDQKIQNSGDIKESKKKDEKIKATAFDVLSADYDNKLDKIESGKEKADNTGWILTAVDVKTIETGLRMNLKKGEQRFNSTLSANKETDLAKRNAALEAMLKKKKDYSKFAHLSNFMKEYFAQKSVTEFINSIDELKQEYERSGKFMELNDNIRSKLNTKTKDPVFRYGLNLLIRRKAKDKKGNDVTAALKKYDEYLNSMLILQTQAPLSDTEKNRLRQKFNPGFFKKKLSGVKSADEMIRDNEIKQRHFAKMMFLMQLGNFKQTDTDNNKKQTKTYDSTISEALAHGYRIGVSLPAGNEAQQNELFSAWQGDAADQMYGRYATYDINRRKTQDNNSEFTEVNKANQQGEIQSTYTDNYGMDLAIGGMGKRFSDDQMIDDQGKYGHMYQRYLKGDANTCGGMLIGIENSAPKGMVKVKGMFGGNSGKTATGESRDSKTVKIQRSAFYSNKELRKGDDQNGRLIDLSNMKAADLANVLREFDRMYRRLQEKANKTVTSKNAQRAKQQQKDINDAKRQLNELNALLAGKYMTEEDLKKLFEKLNINKNKADAMIADARKNVVHNVNNDNNDDDDDDDEDDDEN